jgi:tRNA A37 threonylcarbamoyladenosine synthetase subunit TsaC/SUA5/YrdC
VVQGIVKALGNPIVSSSLHDTEDELMDYFNDPYLIYEKYKDKVDAVVNGGYGNLQASTVIDVSAGQFEIIRQGLGETEHLW